MFPSSCCGDAVIVARVVRQLADSTCSDITDIGARPFVAHQYGGRIVTGSPVHTEYRSHVTHEPSGWRAHK